MRKMLYFRIGGVEVHLLKLCGALILFAALLGILNASAVMWQSWGIIDSVKKSISNNPVEFEASPKVECIDSVFKVTGTCVSPKQTRIDNTQYWIALSGPIMMLLFWAAVFVFGWMVYNLGRAFIPIEEDEKELPERTRRKK